VVGEYLAMESEGVDVRFVPLLLLFLPPSVSARGIPSKFSVQFNSNPKCFFLPSFGRLMARITHENQPVGGACIFVPLFSLVFVAMRRK